MVPDQSQTLVFALVIGAVGFGIFHSFFSHTDWYKRWVWIPFLGFTVTFAAVYLAKFDDCTKYPICFRGWAEGQGVPQIEAKVEAGPLIDAIDLNAGKAKSEPPPAAIPKAVVAAKVEPSELEGQSGGTAAPATAPRPKPTATPQTEKKPATEKQPAARATPGADPICPEGFSCSPETGKRPAEREPPKMVAAWAAVPAVDPLAGLKTSLKGELRRLNCLKGSDDASWGKDAVSAINRFNVYGYTKASAEPDEETLQMLRSVKEPVCP